MKWVKNFDLFLFDLDGLLVNTEQLHFLAYQRACESYGVPLSWNFSRYCEAAHYEATNLQKQIYESFPELKAREPNWELLYAKKQRFILELLESDFIQLMPGVDELLSALEKENCKSCVVTNSADALVRSIRKSNPVLNQISHWVTRNDYVLPKPNPECYLTAIKRFAKPGDRIIGFEDTPRGLTALLQTPATPVLVTAVPYPEIPAFIAQGALHFHTLPNIRLLRKPALVGKIGDF